MSSPTHDELAQYLRCLIYEMHILALATERMVKEPDKVSAEVYKTAALIKLRTIYDFFHRPTASDTIKISMFKDYKAKTPKPLGKDWDTWLNHQSINTYVVHLDKDRVTKIFPQPKFSKGENAVLHTTISLLHDAKEFVDSVIDHKDFVGLNEYGILCREHFEDSFHRLNEGI